MGCFSNQCSSRTLLTLLSAAEAALIVKHTDRLAELLTTLFDVSCLESGLLSISRSGELAILIGRTLARVPIAGGAPRELLEGVSDADWAPDGSALAVARSGRLDRQSPLSPRPARRVPLRVALRADTSAAERARRSEPARDAVYDSDAGARA